MIRSPRVLLGILLVLLVGVSIGTYLFFTREKPIAHVEPEPTPLPEVVEAPEDRGPRVLGSSVEGRPIELYSFGTGETNLLFVGGIHGGYEWNSVLLAYAFIDLLTSTHTALPDGVRVHVIPSLNPDGVFTVVGKEGRFVATDVPAGTDTSPGRFNAHGVDLNRNFACKWQPQATWRGKTVGAGDFAFSEPEAVVLKDVVNELNPRGVVFWHSKANAVYASECEEGILGDTRLLMDTYAHASGYTAVDVFDAYPVTGDAEGWLASIGIPAITVELETRESIEWEKNLAGFRAVLEHYATGVRE